MTSENISFLKFAALGMLILFAALSAGCSSICVPVKVDRVYYHPEIHECTVIINDIPYGLRSESECKKIVANKTMMMSFDTWGSAYQGISYVCGAP